MAPHEQHTLGRGPRSVALTPLPQGMGLLPSAAGEVNTGGDLRSAAVSSSACEGPRLGVPPSAPWEVGQRTQSGTVQEQQLHRCKATTTVSASYHYN